VKTLDDFQIEDFDLFRGPASALTLQPAHIAKTLRKQRRD
jgi:hypothetical protein